MSDTKGLVLLIDDHAIVREGLRTLLEQSGGYGVIEAGDARRGYRAVRESRPGIMVTDLALPGSSGIGLIRRVHSCAPRTRILALSMYEEPIFARRALEAGASGYLAKRAASEELLQGIEAIDAGRRYIDVHTAQRLAAESVEGGSGLSQLSVREFEILRAFAEGTPAREIARDLDLSVNTVGNHRRNIMAKLGARSTTDLVRIAARDRLINI